MYRFNSFYVHFLVIYLIYAFIIHKAFISCNKHSTLRYNHRLGELITLSLPLIILGMFRGETVGGDLENYIPHFDAIVKINSVFEIWDVSVKEPGYQILTYIIGKICPEHRAFLSVTSILSLIGPLYLIYKYSPRITLSIYLYYALGFYTNTFNNIRQSLALSICFFALPALFDKKFRRFLIIVLLAVTFHYSAIFFVSLYPLVNSRFSLRKICIILLIAIILYGVFSISIMKTLLTIMAFKYDPSSIGTATESKGISLLIMYSVILLAEILLYLRYKRKQNLKHNTVVKYAICFQTLSCICQMYAPLFSSMMRLTYYFYIPIIVFVPLLMREYVRFKYIILSSYILISGLFLYMTYNKSSEIESNSQGVIPYVFLNTVIY